MDTHALCAVLAECPCRDEGNLALLRDLYKAIHGEYPPALPEPPAEVWNRLVRSVSHSTTFVQAVVDSAAREGDDKDNDQFTVRISRQLLEQAASRVPVSDRRRAEAQAAWENR